MSDLIVKAAVKDTLSDHNVSADFYDALDDDQRRQGYPWKFYGLTEAGREFLEEHNLLAAEETLQQIYDTISDKPEKMVKYENATRPDSV